MTAKHRATPEDGISHLRVSLTERAYVGPGRADLLQHIDETGSISAAGRAMGMSYRRAWALVKEMNDSFGVDLVQTTRGGSAQGGASLTQFGKEVLVVYRGMLDKAGQAIIADVASLRKRMGT